MTQRPLHLHQAVLAGLSVSIFVTVLNTLQAPPGSRVAAFLLTAGCCAVAVSLVPVVARAVQARRPH